MAGPPGLGWAGGNGVLFPNQGLQATRSCPPLAPVLLPPGAASPLPHGVSPHCLQLHAALWHHLPPQCCGQAVISCGLGLPVDRAMSPLRQRWGALREGPGTVGRKLIRDSEALGSSGESGVTLPPGQWPGKRRDLWTQIQAPTPAWALPGSMASGCGLTPPPSTSPALHRVMRTAAAPAPGGRQQRLNEIMCARDLAQCPQGVVKIKPKKGLAGQFSGPLWVGRSPRLRDPGVWGRHWPWKAAR